MLFGQPSGDGGSGGTQDHIQIPLLGFGNHTVKEGEVIPPFNRLHQVPGKLGDANRIPSHLPYGVHVGVHTGGVPLFRIIIDT